MNIRQERMLKGMPWNEAWSLVEGCSPVSAGCDECWLATFAKRQSLNPVESVAARYGGVTDVLGHFNGTVRFRHGDLDKPWRTAYTARTAWRRRWRMRIASDRRSL